MIPILDPSTIILAAGESRRYPGADKLGLTLGDSTVLGSVVKAAMDVSAEVVLVSRSEDAFRQAAPDVMGKVDRPGVSGERSDGRGNTPGVYLTINSDTCRGLSSSIGVGAAFLLDLRSREEPTGPLDPDRAVLIWPGDLPFVRPETVRSLLRDLKPDEIRRPREGSRVGHPVAFGARFLVELSELREGDGARTLLARHAEAVRFLETDDVGIWRDIDTVDDYRAVLEKWDA